VKVSKRVRLEDVAAEVGLSPASVSLVLRGVAGPSAETRAAPCGFFSTPGSESRISLRI
jgi:transcriptional regulator with XRE-family HTH domain